MRQGFAALLILGFCFSVHQAVAQQREPENLPAGKGALPTKPTQSRPVFGVTCITNETAFQVAFIVRWNYSTATWQEYYLAPGEKIPFSWPLGDQTSTPDLVLQFDDDPFQYGWQTEQWVLERGRSLNPDCNSGRQYSFVGESSVQIVAR